MHGIIQVFFWGRVRFGTAVLALDISAPGLFGARTFFLDLLFCTYVVSVFVARFARGRIEDSNFNRFALNGIQEIACFIVFSS